MLWGYVITGAVGVAGMTATLLSVKISVNAETRRAHDAEKRRIYAGCLAAFGGLINSMARTHTLARSAGGRLGTDLITERGVALTAMYNSVGELILIAPKQVSALAESTSTKLLKCGRDNHDWDAAVAEFRAVREQLVLAMRADLGESG